MILLCRLDNRLYNRGMATRSDNDPVTKKEFGAFRRDFRDLKREVDGIDVRLIRIEKAVTNIDGRLEKVEARLEKVEKTLERILDIVLSLDNQFKKFSDLPERMDQAEDDIIKLKARVR